MHQRLCRIKLVTDMIAVLAAEDIEVLRSDILSRDEALREPAHARGY